MADDEFEVVFDDFLVESDTMSEPSLLMLYGGYGSGKGLIYGTPVATTTGWTKVEDLTIGSEVIGADGNPTRVYGIWDRGILPVYTVRMSDGSRVTVDGDHLWTVSNDRGVTMTLPTSDIIRRLDAPRPRPLYIPTVAPVQYTGGDLPIPAYAFGALLADGYLAGAAIQWTKNDQAVVDAMRASLESGGFSLREVTRDTSTARQWKIDGGDQSIRAAVIGLDANHKSAGKFIPECYLTASEADRWALIRGLFDGDGTRSSSRAQAQYHTISRALADDVASLAWSLGIAAHVSPVRQGDGTWRVGILDDSPVFFASKHASVPKTHSRDRSRRAIVSITPAGHGDVRCIAVEAADQLYVTKDYIVTHNTHLALSASEVEGLYPVLVIDNEGSTQGVLSKFDASRIDVIRPKAQWPGKEWIATKKILNDLLTKKHKYKTVIIDPLNSMLAWGKVAGDKPGDGFAKWNFVHSEFTEDGGLIDRLKNAPFLAILVLHEKTEDGDGEGPSVKDFRWQGQGTSQLGQFPDAVLYTSRETNSAGQSTTTLFTAPTKKNKAKNRFGFPAKVEAPTMQGLYDFIRTTNK